MTPHLRHIQTTQVLALQLKKQDIYDWLVHDGYFPEAYVLPPCFKVVKAPTYGTVYFQHKKSAFKPPIREYQQVHFPKTDLTDRTFGFIDPELHSDMASTIAKNWRTIVNLLFHKENRVCAYSFPIPLNSKTPGQIGQLKSGRMIYEFIEMAENDAAAIAYKYKYLVTADIKNFYPSVYTHSIPWAIHGKKRIRKGSNRHDFSFFGNRLDKLFQNANDGCTNGIPIGPVVSDVIAEIILAGVDLTLSRALTKEGAIADNVTILRFKDDYRVLALTEQDARTAIKCLQAALKEYRLELHDSKTRCHKLPDGLFRKWVSEYHSANPNPKYFYKYRRFKETYLAVINIDRNNPDCGVIDRFLADIVTRKQRLRVQITPATLPKIISLLFMLAELRIKAFPKILAIVEEILNGPVGDSHKDAIAAHLREYLTRLSKKEAENRYLIAWIYYFIRTNGLEKQVGHGFTFSDPIVRAIVSSRFTKFRHCKDFKIFAGVKGSGRRVSMLEHLDLFKPQ